MYYFVVLCVETLCIFVVNIFYHKDDFQTKVPSLRQWDFTFRNIFILDFYLRMQTNLFQHSADSYAIRHVTFKYSRFSFGMHFPRNGVCSL